MSVPKKRVTLQDIMALPMVGDRVLPLIHTLSTDSAKIFFVDHAEKRMVERGITRPQVIECLRHGTVTEPPHQDIHGRWRCTINHSSCGDRIQVVASPDEGRLLVIVITVF